MSFQIVCLALSENFHISHSKTCVDDSVVKGEHAEEQQRRDLGRHSRDSQVFCDFVISVNVITTRERYFGL